MWEEGRVRKGRKEGGARKGVKGSVLERSPLLERAHDEIRLPPPRGVVGRLVAHEASEAHRVHRSHLGLGLGLGLRIGFGFGFAIGLGFGIGLDGYNASAQRASKRSSQCAVSSASSAREKAEGCS